MQQIPKWETDKYWNSIQQICFWQAGNPFKTGADLSKLDGFRVPSYRWKLWWDDGGDEDGDDQASSSLALSPCSSSSAPFHSQYIAFLFSGDCAICSLSRGNMFYFHRQILLIFGSEIQTKKKQICRSSYSAELNGGLSTLSSCGLEGKFSGNDCGNAWLSVDRTDLGNDLKWFSSSIGNYKLTPTTLGKGSFGNIDLADEPSWTSK